MIDKIIKALYSAKTMGVLLILFAVAMAAGTFIENDFGTETARTHIYEATWFEILMLLLCLNFIGNIFKYRLASLQKIPILLFHLAFIVIILGAGITRYRGFEAMMNIREGESSNTMVSMNSYIHFSLGNDHYINNFTPQRIQVSEIARPRFSETYEFEGKEFQVDALEYIPRAVLSLEDDEQGKAYLHVVTSTDGNRTDSFIKEGTSKKLGAQKISFGADSASMYVQKIGNKWMLTLKDTCTFLTMDMSTQGTIPADSTHELKTRVLYIVNGMNVVFLGIKENAKLIAKEDKTLDKNTAHMSALKVKVSSGEEQEEVYLLGGKGFINPAKEIEMNGLNVKLNYGSKIMPLPFSLHLNDFQLERYPGSHSPSSFASEIEVHDGETQFPYRIFMNNVLDYEGYRFFQSAFDHDEKGTILSVNHDFWGTTVTYVGYFLLVLGMLASLVWNGSYFRYLIVTTFR